MNEEIESKSKLISPAYVSYKTFKNFIETLTSKGGCPDKIDSSVLPTMSGANQKHLISSLKFLKLINKEHYASVHLVQLIESGIAKNDDNIKKILALVVKDAYAFLFENGFVERATTQQAETKFREYGVSGETVSKGLMFFIHIAGEANINISPHIQPYKGKRRSTESKPKNDKNKRSTSKDTPPPIKDNNSKDSMQDKVSNMWREQVLSKFPVFNPEWSDEAQQKWQDNFCKLMEMIKEK